MKILVLDDSEQVLDDIAEYMRSVNPEHIVVTCNNCASITYQYDSCEAPFDLFVLDLNVRTLGLTKDQAQRTKNGLFTGWIALREIILHRTPEASIVIFSGWCKALETYILSKESTDEEKKLYYELLRADRLIYKINGYEALKKFIQ